MLVASSFFALFFNSKFSTSKIQHLIYADELLTNVSIFVSAKRAPSTVLGAFALTLNGEPAAFFCKSAIVPSLLMIPTFKVIHFSAQMSSESSTWKMPTLIKLGIT